MLESVLIEYSTLSIPSSVPRPSECYSDRLMADMRAERRKESGLSFVNCPTCNSRASCEVITVTKPGSAPVTRVMIRCMRKTRVSWDRTGKPACPVVTYSEAPSGDPVDMPPPFESKRKMIQCSVCGITIPKPRSRDTCEPCYSSVKKAMQKIYNEGRIYKETCMYCGSQCVGLRCRACINEGKDTKVS